LKRAGVKERERGRGIRFRSLRLADEELLIEQKQVDEADDWLVKRMKSRWMYDQKVQCSETKKSVPLRN